MLINNDICWSEMEGREGVNGSGSSLTVKVSSFSYYIWERSYTRNIKAGQETVGEVQLFAKQLSSVIAELEKSTFGLFMTIGF